VQSLGDWSGAFLDWGVRLGSEIRDGSLDTHAGISDTGCTPERLDRTGDFLAVFGICVCTRITFIRLSRQSEQPLLCGTPTMV
jgi:hypothetical protein